MFKNRPPRHLTGATQPSKATFTVKTSAVAPGTSPDANPGHLGRFWRKVDFCLFLLRNCLIKNSLKRQYLQTTCKQSRVAGMCTRPEKGIKPSPGTKFHHLERYWDLHKCLKFESTFFEKIAQGPLKSAYFCTCAASCGGFLEFSDDTHRL